MSNGNIADVLGKPGHSIADALGMPGHCIADAVEKAKLNSGGSSGNPNYVETISGTLANPWGGKNIEALGLEINTQENANITMLVTMNDLTATISAFSFEAVPVSIIAQQGTLIEGYVLTAIFVWDENGDLTDAFMFQGGEEGGTLTDLTPMASQIPTVTTIIHHPLPNVEPDNPGEDDPEDPGDPGDPGGDDPGDPSGDTWDCEIDGHEFDGNGFCIHCGEPNPDWDCQTYGHDFGEQGICIHCGVLAPDSADCEIDGHVFDESGICTVCGKQWDCETDGHEFDISGVCTYCGESDPDWDPDGGV